MDVSCGFSFECGVGLWLYGAVSEAVVSVPKVGDKLTVAIHDIAFGGEGVGRLGEFVLFVPFVAVGEEVEIEVTEVKKRFARGKLVKVLRASPHRVEPLCPYFGTCGGCQYQHISYPQQLEVKHKQIVDLFERVGRLKGDAPRPEPVSLPKGEGTVSGDLVASVVPCPQPYGYRNRVMIRSQWNKFKQGLNIGFIQADNRLVVDIEECKISEPAINEQIQEVRRNPPPKGGIKVTLRIGMEESQAARAQRTSRSAPHLNPLPEGTGGAGTGLAELAPPKVPNHERAAAERRPYRWEVPEHSFFQNNFFLLPRLVETVRDRVGQSGVRFLVDAYCGVGFFGIEVADLLEWFVGVELDAHAIKAARRNAAGRGIKNGEFIVGRTEDFLPNILARFRAEETAILLDPPRTGCPAESLQLLRECRPKQVIYVSCHPATLARDLNILCADGVFELARVIPLDMFPQTQHVECVADLRTADVPSAKR